MSYSLPFQALGTIYEETEANEIEVFSEKKHILKCIALGIAIAGLIAAVFMFVSNNAAVTGATLRGAAYNPFQKIGVFFEFWTVLAVPCQFFGFRFAKKETEIQMIQSETPESDFLWAAVPEPVAVAELEPVEEIVFAA